MNCASFDALRPVATMAGIVPRPKASMTSAQDTLDSDERALLVWLEARDAPCPVCGYNLRGVASARCPECAAPLRLEVGSVQTRTGPWLLAMG